MTLTVGDHETRSGASKGDAWMVHYGDGEVVTNMGRTSGFATRLGHFRFAKKGESSCRIDDWSCWNSCDFGTNQTI